MKSFSVSDILNLADTETKKLWDSLRLQYTEPYGHPLLKTEISELYQNISEENILCFAGAEEGVFCTLYELVEPNDHVIVLTPCYQSLLEIPKLKCKNVTEIVLNEANNWKIDLDDIKKQILHSTKWIIINFPHNPTGQVIEEEDLINLIKLCEHNGIWLFSDEVYRLLGTPQKPWSPPAASLYKKAISLGVMSKSFGMAGLRVGWIACQNKQIIDRLKKMKDYLSICNSATSEILSIIALQNKETILSRNNTIVINNLKIIDNFFIKYNHLFEWARPQGGCVGFVKYKGIGSVESFCNKLITNKSVLLMPASVYDYNSNHFRIGFGRKNLPECLTKLEEFLHSKEYLL